MNKRYRNIFLVMAMGFPSFVLFASGKQQFMSHTVSAITLDSPVITHPDHIIFVWLENQDFDSIIGNPDAPFINSLAKKGTLFTNSHANTHPSYPNYIDFFAGDDNGVKDDACIDHSSLTTPNLYTILKSAGKSFAWYSEDLPKTGSKVCRYENYVAKHNPTTIFNNVPGDINKRFKDFPADYNLLENVVNISPNEVNDMHSASVQQGDRWVKKYLAALVEWCTTHNSIFVIYFDENGTNPDSRIPVIAVGQQVKVNYRQNELYDHFSWTKTVCSMFAVPDNWTDNVGNAKLITGCWK
jgi:phosphatidylinositol-3-phosphatase